MEVNKEKELENLINREYHSFQELDSSLSVVKNSIPILWFGDIEAYFASEKKIVTVSLNPSDKEFCPEEGDDPGPEHRFPSYKREDPNSLYQAYNEYFQQNPYSQWFNASYRAVLEGFNASFFGDAENNAVHTDIGSPYATSPTWSGLSKEEKEVLEKSGSDSWHRLIKILCPDIVLFSSSDGHEEKIRFDKVGDWKDVDVGSSRPLRIGSFRIHPDHTFQVLFQVQGRKPFHQTSGASEKRKFAEYLY